MKKIIFDGAYGIRSYGDDAPLIVLVEMLRSRLGEIDAVVVNRHVHDYDYSEYGMRSVCGIEYETKEESVGKWFRGFNPTDDKQELCHLYKEIESSDLLVLGAGNFLVDYTIDILKGPVSRFLVLSLMAKMSGTPIFWFGMSVGPLMTKMGRDMTRLAANLATLITVRDEKSIEELQRLGVDRDVFVLPDAVFGLELPLKNHGMQFTAYREAHLCEDGVIAISVRSMTTGMGMSSEDYITLMAKICDHLVDSWNYNVLFIPQCTYEFGNYNEDDRNIAAEIIKCSRNKNKLFSVDEKINAFDCLSLYEGAIGSICTRLHGNVFSIRHGVPTVGLNYNPKVYEFYKWLGCQNYVLDFEGLNEVHVISKLVYALNHQSLFKVKAEKIVDDGIPNLEKYADYAVAAMNEKINYTKDSVQ